MDGGPGRESGWKIVLLGMGLLGAKGNAHARVCDVETCKECRLFFKGLEKQSCWWIWCPSQRQLLLLLCLSV
jgi:hypothetical protein